MEPAVTVVDDEDERWGCSGPAFPLLGSGCDCSNDIGVVCVCGVELAVAGGGAAAAIGCDVDNEERTEAFRNAELVAPRDVGCTGVEVPEGGRAEGH